MIGKILVPTDFSDAAGVALKYAIGLAKKAGSTITVFHVNHVAMIDASMPAETYQLFVTEAENNTKSSFDELVENYLRDSGVSYYVQSQYGFVADEICDYAQKEKYDLIVMGTTGSSGIEEVLIGSNAASVVGKTPIPVLVIPAGTPFKNLERIVYATDYNEPEFPAVMRLIFFAELFNADLSIVHVKSEYDHFFNAENNFFKKNKSNISYDKINFIELEKGDIISRINEYVEGYNADLVVMAKHNRNFFDRLFHRSLAKKMAYHTSMPLLVLVKD